MKNVAVDHTIIQNTEHRVMEWLMTALDFPRGFMDVKHREFRQYYVRVAMPRASLWIGFIVAAQSEEDNRDI